MARFDRYMLSQFMVLFGFFSLVLVLIYWINRRGVAVRPVDRRRQSAAVFLEFTALSLPSVMRLALPLAAFAATVYVTNRMSTEAELTVVQATGYSPFRLRAPVLYFGAIVAFDDVASAAYLVPLSSAKLAERETRDCAKHHGAAFNRRGAFLNRCAVSRFISAKSHRGANAQCVFVRHPRRGRTRHLYGRPCVSGSAGRHHAACDD